jgi:Lar family restriction alleviation protein
MIASPCPFCGSHQVHVEQWSDMVTVSCLDCLAIGPVTAEQSQAEAWERWNRRASPADGLGLALVDPPDDPDDPDDSQDSPAISEPPQPTACFASATLVQKTHYQKGPQ